METSTLRDAAKYTFVRQILRIIKFSSTEMGAWMFMFVPCVLLSTLFTWAAMQTNIDYFALGLPNYVDQFKSYCYILFYSFASSKFLLNRHNLKVSI